MEYSQVLCCEEVLGGGKITLNVMVDEGSKEKNLPSEFVNGELGMFTGADCV